MIGEGGKMGCALLRGVGGGVNHWGGREGLWTGEGGLKGCELLWGGGRGVAS